MAVLTRREVDDGVRATLRFLSKVEFFLSSGLVSNGLKKDSTPPPPNEDLKIIESQVDEQIFRFRLGRGVSIISEWPPHERNRLTLMRKIEPFGDDGAVIKYQKQILRCGILSFLNFSSPITGFNMPWFDFFRGNYCFALRREIIPDFSGFQDGFVEKGVHACKNHRSRITSHWTTRPTKLTTNLID